jgi:ribonuclease D
MNAPLIHLVPEDLPAGITFKDNLVAIDTETTGLSLTSDRLCLVQIGNGHNEAWLVKFDQNNPNYAAPNLRAVLTNLGLTKVFHYARFDVAMLQKHLNITSIGPVFCTKVASKLVRPQATKHNLRTLVADYAGVELDKTEQMSDWAAPVLSASQQAYAASDVLYLHTLATQLQAQLAAQNLIEAYQQALNFLATRVALDLRGFPETDLFAHH